MDRNVPTGPGHPIERVRGEHPTDESWRADALAKSRHSRLLDEIRAPLEDHRPDHARRLCAEICRSALGDFAPALILLPGAARRRAQALAAYSLTLFDFAHQPGLEGERLAQINRWEFNLEQALGGNPPGQPAFVAMATEHSLHPWPIETLDRLATVARYRAVGKPEYLATHDDHEVVGAIFQALSDCTPPADVIVLGSALLELRRFQRADRIDRSEPGRETETHRPRHGEAIRRIEAELDQVKLHGVPAAWRPALRFLHGAGQRLAKTLQPTDSKSAGQSRLGLTSRVSLLLRARLSR